MSPFPAKETKGHSIWQRNHAIGSPSNRGIWSKSAPLQPAEGDPNRLHSQRQPSLRPPRELEERIPDGGGTVEREKTQRRPLPARDVPRSMRAASPTTRRPPSRWPHSRKRARGKGSTPTRRRSARPKGPSRRASPNRPLRFSSDLTPDPVHRQSD